MTDARTTDTRRRLMDAVLETIRTTGITKVSARTIAATGGLNQALVFYHFGSVDNLIGEACLAATKARIDAFADRFAAVSSFTDLVTVARDLQTEERAAGNTQVLAQVLAGSYANPGLAQVVGRALQLRVDQVEEALERVLAGSPLAGIFDSATLARLVSGTFIGTEQLEQVGLGVDPTGDSAPDQLEKLARTLDGLGPIARRALRSSLQSG